MLHALVRSIALSGLLLALAIAPAFAQAPRKRVQTDQELIVKLHELTRAKGDYVTRLGPGFCRRLGVRPIGFCEAFQTEFIVNGRRDATFYSLDDGRNGMVRIFITTYLEKGYVDDFRVDAEGRLERVVRRRGETTSRVAVKDAVGEFQRVMDFLRDHQDDVADWPDAKIVDDGSCPKGRVKRIPRDPRHAICVDRKRLKLNSNGRIPMKAVRHGGRANALPLSHKGRGQARM